MDLNLKDTELKFAHDVGINATIRVEKTKRGAVKKEIFPELIFIDTTGKRIVSRIMIPFKTLTSMSELLNNSLKEFNKQLKSKDIPKQSKIETKSTNSSYLG